MNGYYFYDYTLLCQIKQNDIHTLTYRLHVSVYYFLTDPDTGTRKSNIHRFSCFAMQSEANKVLVNVYITCMK